MRGMRAEDRRRQIRDLARDVFAEKGYHLTTIDDIVARADVARATFYLYFPDKRSIFEELVDGFLERISAEISHVDVHAEESAFSQVHGNLTRVFAVALADPAMTKVLFNVAIGFDPSFDAKLLSFYATLQQLIEESLEEGQQLKLVRAGDRRIMAQLGLGALKELLVQNVARRPPPTAEELASETMDFLAAGILTPEAAG